MSKPFLVEILTAELPPKALKKFAENFLKEITERLTKLELTWKDASYFATPRRIAVLIKAIAEKQADTVIERKGPAIKAAFDANQQPTSACLGFLKSANATLDDLITIKTEQGEWVGVRQKMIGKSAQILLPDVIKEALAALPIPKRMRWGHSDTLFVRPVHSIVMLYGDTVIDAVILGHRADRLTLGHRFLSKKNISIANPKQYEKALEKKYVIADFQKRKNKIRDSVMLCVSTEVGLQAKPIIPEILLDEVTGLVEWPVVLLGQFDEAFLTVPQEALISAMQDHQRYFPVVNEEGRLLPYFVMVSNIESLDSNQVIAGNERVLRARLSDAKFFFETDKKIKLTDRLEKLKQIVYQEKLGSLYDKTLRLVDLSSYLADKLPADKEKLQQAALLSKTDLTTDMVGEFPELQGVMGYYYALNEGLSEEIASALDQYYCPRFSGDLLPRNALATALALADRMDTLVGVFGSYGAPTGDKDPFALRRAALGILRILIEKKIDIDLEKLIDVTLKAYPQFKQTEIKNQLLTFFMDRLKPFYQDQGITTDIFLAVVSLKNYHPSDIDQRVQAVKLFKTLPEAASLSVANKRVSNILAKNESTFLDSLMIDKALLEEDAEKILFDKIIEKEDKIKALKTKGDYQAILSELANLREPVDLFFDKVLVMTDDQKKQQNRVMLLKQLRQLFLHVADIALLQ